MRVNSNLLKRRVSRGAYLRHRGKTYKVTAAGARALALMREIAHHPSRHSLTGLLQIRREIRRVFGAVPPVALSCLIDTTEVPRVLRLAIWMCGKAGCKYAIPSIARRARHGDVRVQRDAVRALRRLSAWTELKQIVASAESGEIRAFAERDVTPGTSRPFTDRLGAFLAHSKACPIALSEPSLVVHQRADRERRRHPRSATQIRRYLRRVRLMIRRSRTRRRCLCPRHLTGLRATG